jgi:hypothetical protein
MKKMVTFDECITIRHYEYDRNEEYEEKRGRDWQITTDLTCREFKLPIEKGGCGGEWDVLQCKLDQLEEPYWYLIGQLWQRMYPGIRRIEEEDDEEDDEEDEEGDEEEEDEGIGCNNCYSCVSGGCSPCILEGREIR